MVRSSRTAVTKVITVLACDGSNVSGSNGACGGSWYWRMVVVKGGSGR